MGNYLLSTLFFEFRQKYWKGIFWKSVYWRSFDNRIEGGHKDDRKATDIIKECGANQKINKNSLQTETSLDHSALRNCGIEKAHIFDNGVRSAW